MATDGAVVWSFKAIRPCIRGRLGLSDVATSGHLFVTTTVLAGPSDQGHDFLMAAYDHVRYARHVVVFGRYTDLLSADKGVLQNLTL